MGIFFNLIVTFIISYLYPDSEKNKKIKSDKHKLLQSITGMSVNRKKKISLAWILTLIWFLVGFGPFATIGNSIFSDPNLPISWGPFGLPSLWIWQILFLVYGIFVMWFLAFHMGFSDPVKIDDVVSYSRKLKKS